MMDGKYRVHEIFFSLQGEGYHTGTPAVFIRFSGCNLHCPFCDTDFNSYRLCSAEDICEQVATVLHTGESLPASSTLVVLTGGEPSLQVDDKLVESLHRLADTICIETNGTHPVPKGIDWVTCSPKEGSRVVLLNADEVKVVYTGQDVEHWRRQIMSKHWFLQPCSCQNTADTVNYVLHHPAWRLSLQTHKLVGIE